MSSACRVSPLHLLTASSRRKKKQPGPFIPKKGIKCSSLFLLRLQLLDRSLAGARMPPGQIAKIDGSCPRGKESLLLLLLLLPCSAQNASHEAILFPRSRERERDRTARAAPGWYTAWACFIPRGLVVLFPAVLPPRCYPCPCCAQLAGLAQSMPMRRSFRFTCALGEGWRCCCAAVWECG